MGLFDKPRTATTNEPAKPVIERHAGTVLPGGRGMELHGVAQYGTPDIVDEIEMGDLVTVPPEPDEPTPIPVRVISSSRRELKRWRAYRHVVPADGTVIQIAGLDDRRTNLRIQNLGGDGFGADEATVYIADEPHLANPTNGFPIPPLPTPFVIDAETPVYASVVPNAAPTGQVLSILVEYTVDVQE